MGSIWDMISYGWFKSVLGMLLCTSIIKRLMFLPVWLVNQ